MKRRVLKIEAAVGLLREEHEVVGGRRVRVVRAAEHAHEQVEVAVAVVVAEGRSVVAARPDRVVEGEGTRFHAEVRRLARAGVLDQEESGLEEVAPEHVRVAVRVVVGQRHRVRPVQGGEGPARVRAVEGRYAPGGRRVGDDLDVLETVRDVPEGRGVRAERARRLVARDRPHEAADEEVEAAVAVDVRRVGDVLPVREDRLTARVAEGVRDEFEYGPARRAGVPIELHVAEGGLREEVPVSVRVDIHEAEPLSDLEVRVRLRPPGVEPSVRRVLALEEQQAVRRLLHEEVEVAVSVDVHPLRAGHVEAAEEGDFVRVPGFVEHRKGRDGADESGFGAGRALRRQLPRPGAARCASRREERRGQRSRRGPPTPGPGHAAHVAGALSAGWRRDRCPTRRAVSR